MIYKFYKYQGTGNDFIMIDNRTHKFPLHESVIQKMCHRRFGIGADGLIALENSTTSDFKMVYFNSDGRESTMCGNGGRSIVAFAKDLGLISGTCNFEAVDGLHYAKMSDYNVVNLQMIDVDEVQVREDHVFLNTGSPHHVQLVTDLSLLDVKSEGAKIRYGSLYGVTGSNVNFVEQRGEATFDVRTYERGVEDETYSCGTGVTAVAISMYEIGMTDSNHISLNTPGGELKVYFNKKENGYSDIFLCGQALKVFEGQISI